MLLFVLLQATQTPWMGNLILIGGIIIIFYFFMVRPQQKKQRDQKSFLENMKKGDQVVTIGGLHGRIAAIEGETIILEVDRGTRLTFEKNSISQEASKRLNKTKQTLEAK
jgi:preprotein translocase subunit YajC